MDTLDPITEELHRGLEAQVFPGAVLHVRVQGHTRYHRAVGLSARLPREEPAHVGTIYDLASLTKPLATTTATLCLIQDGALTLDQPVEAWLEELQGSPIGRATIRQLLNHGSGLPAWRPLFKKFASLDPLGSGMPGTDEAKAVVLNAMRDEPLDYPPGTQHIYSDLGYILLGFAIERCRGHSLAEYCQERMYGPLGAEPLFFIGADGARACGTTDLRDVAPTERDPWRGRLVRAQVHDENACILGGIAGHAGLFGSAAAVSTMAGAWLNSYLGRSSFLDPGLVHTFVTRSGLVNESAQGSWGLGWDTPSTPSSSGMYFSPQAFGHLGYTGTSVWIDPSCELEVVLLSNRVHPRRGNNKIQAFRPRLHDRIYQELIGKG